jgi:hypothetical protein
LYPSDAYVQKWKQALPESFGLEVGINWAGNSTFRYDANRSILLPGILPVIAEKIVIFFALQKDLRAGDLEILRRTPQINYCGEQTTREDAAAILALTDLVISSDTPIIHLAGAMGKPVGILLGAVADWRWLLNCDDNPWYSVVRLFSASDPRRLEKRC